MIDSSRHDSVFSPAGWGERRVDVIGIGATGSKVAFDLAKLGVRNLHIWDFDDVEGHNIANQMYPPSCIGMHKAEALAGIIEEYTGMHPTEHGEWRPGESVGEVVFVMVDVMSVRRQIFDAYRWTPTVRLVVDSRMSSDLGYLYSYRPASDSARQYESTLYGDDDATVEVSVCGTAITVGPTASILAGYAVWQFIKHAASLTDVTVHFDPSLAIGAREPALNVL